MAALRQAEYIENYRMAGISPVHGCKMPARSGHSGRSAPARLFAPEYRRTPEHPHPAQAEDAFAAWGHALQTTPPERIVVIGDSAGGHMALMRLQSLKALGKPQPALCIGLCPWTDIGDRGESLHANDPTDLVQGWMALRFGDWLHPKGQFGRDALSLIAHDFAGLALLYLQAGGREVLQDMIRDFAKQQAALGATVTFGEWAEMPHDFPCRRGADCGICGKNPARAAMR